MTDNKVISLKEARELKAKKIEAKKKTENPYAEEKDAYQIFLEALNRYQKQKEEQAKERNQRNERTKRNYQLNRRKDDV